MPGQRVLIVDDEQRTLMFLRESLVVSGLNAETTCVSSAEAALQAFAQLPFDVVITDMRLEGEMNGLQLLERLIEMCPNLRAIVVSAYQDSKLEEAAREMGVYQCFRKPFAFDEFTGAVAQALREAAMDADQPRLVVGWRSQFILRQLTALLRDTGAQCAFLSDGDGKVVARVGEPNGFDGPWPAPTAALEPAFNFAYYQGKTHDLYSAEVGHGLRLSLAFDRNQPSSRIGLVLQYTRRVVQELTAALDAPVEQAA
jgi:CheY-like chemotaxis protein